MSNSLKFAPVEHESACEIINCKDGGHYQVIVTGESNSEPSEIGVFCANHLRFLIETIISATEADFAKGLYA